MDIAKKLNLSVHYVQQQRAKFVLTTVTNVELVAAHLVLTTENIQPVTAASNILFLVSETTKRPFLFRVRVLMSKIMTTHPYLYEMGVILR